MFFIGASMQKRGLLILERISIFDEEGVLSMMPPKAAQYPTEKKIKSRPKAVKYEQLTINID